MNETFPSCDCIQVRLTGTTECFSTNTAILSFFSGAFLVLYLSLLLEGTALLLLKSAFAQRLRKAEHRVWEMPIESKKRRKRSR